MKPQNTLTDQRGLVERYDYDGETVVVADTPFADERVAVDVVDGTAIVVVTGDDEDAQHEIELPAGEVARAFINNGIITVEVKR
ncbi:DUF7127 family protein [Halarchaeum nitratireducens]|uniref:Hsp20/alpha crystallin family protein n=1 Tax=Halarchaeum nitratireducens TaxID=489913 RepID=A0A830GBN6_9EURY|nr:MULTISPECIES: hypothetical protein [Halarchaeum]MBP2250648.1 HSP20 family molecular chaperone IbpA [Halarchaeum solikamskense]GGN15884.1 hypothetical protein GCM10009021_15440 [Halarchaeum nitratireducens]